MKLSSFPTSSQTQHYPPRIAAHNKQTKEALFPFVFFIAQKAGLPHHPQCGSSNPHKISHLQRQRALRHSNFLALGCQGRCPEAGVWVSTGPRGPVPGKHMFAGGRGAQALLPLGLTLNRDAEARCPSPAAQTDGAHGPDRGGCQRRSTLVEMSSPKIWGLESPPFLLAQGALSGLLGPVCCTACKS